MALAQMSFFSRSLRQSTHLNVLLPDAGSGPFPVWYLLHGLSDDYSMWLRRTSLERYLAALPLIVVMPDGGRGWYTNAQTPPGRAYEDHLVKDIMTFVDRLLPTIPRREGRVIGGLSMGGYGAVKLAFKHPELFCAAASHSGVLMTPLHKPESRSKELQLLHPEFESIFGSHWRGGPDDPVALARACPIHLRPALYIDCGTNDFLLEQNREFHAALDGLRIGHDYHEFPGDHQWDYWDTHVQDSLAFLRRALRL